MKKQRKKSNELTEREKANEPNRSTLSLARSISFSYHKTSIKCAFVPGMELSYGKRAKSHAKSAGSSHRPGKSFSFKTRTVSLNTISGVPQREKIILRGNIDS